MDYLLGVDVGTTGTKTLLVDEAGKVCASSYKGYKLTTSHGSYVEQDAEEWWNAVVYTVRDCISQFSLAGRIAAVALSTQGGSLVPVNKKGVPLRLALTWMDKRAGGQGDRLEQGLTSEKLYGITGWHQLGCLPLVEIMWLAENEPEIYREAALFLTTHDFLSLRMTGQAVIDPSNAAMTQLYNIRKQCWDPDLLQRVDISQSQLPRVIPSGKPIGKLTNEAAEELGISKETMVIAGGHDQYCGALGSNTLNSGDVMISTGTAWVMTAITQSPLFASESCFSPGVHVVSGCWGALASMATGGVALEWFREKLGLTAVEEGKGLENYSVIDAEAEKRGPGAGGVMFFPYFTGSFCPTKHASNRATMFGLELSHDRYHIARAIMEGIAFEARWMMEELENLGASVDTIRMLGGAAKSRLWTNILTNILGRAVIQPKVQDTSCVGAAVLAGVGGGVFPSCTEGIKPFLCESAIEPDIKLSVEYDELYHLYRSRHAHLCRCYK